MAKTTQLNDYPLEESLEKKDDSYNPPPSSKIVKFQSMPSGIVKVNYFFKTMFEKDTTFDDKTRLMILFNYSTIGHFFQKSKICDLDSKKILVKGISFDTYFSKINRLDYDYLEEVCNLVDNQEVIDLLKSQPDNLQNYKCLLEQKNMDQFGFVFKYLETFGIITQKNKDSKEDESRHWSLTEFGNNVVFTIERKRDIFKLKSESYFNFSPKLIISDMFNIKDRHDIKAKDVVVDNGSNIGNNNSQGQIKNSFVKILTISLIGAGILVTIWLVLPNHIQNKFIEFFNKLNIHLSIFNLS